MLVYTIKQEQYYDANVYAILVNAIIVDCLSSVSEIMKPDYLI